MNVYGYIPPSHFPSHSTLTYWAHAASFAGLPSSDSTLASAGLVLGLKKSQLPLLSGEDFTLKGSNSTSPSAEDDFPSLFRVTSSLTSHDPLGGLAHGSIQFHAHIHHQQQHLRKQQQQQQQQHHHHHRPVFSTSPSLGSGIAPLQALCDSDVSAFSTKTLGTSSGSASSSDAKGNLKFGMSRILSDDFGKSRSEKENNFQLSAVPEACRSLTLCPCNSASCTTFAGPSSPYHRGSLSSLSAVHALQPPNYPLSTSADALPGPYSILSTDSSMANQPKRKRSWSRAVFSNLQRKGLEKRFEVQKYVTKPDRRQLAAMLGLTDAQVKVWFQNRRMKWRHAQQQGDKDKEMQQPDHKQGSENNKQNSGTCDVMTGADRSPRESKAEDAGAAHEFPGSSGGSAPAADLAEKKHLDKAGTTKSTRGRTESASCSDLGSRLHSSGYPADDSLNVSTSCELRKDPASDSATCHELTDRPGFEAASLLDNVVLDSPLRPSIHSCNSNGERFEDHNPDHALDSDKDSRSGLDIDSDVDMDDIDAEIMGEMSGDRHGQ